MEPVLVVGFWAVMFIGVHLVTSSTRVRPALVAAVGEQPYRGIYSVAAFATLVPLIIVFGRHKHSGPMLWYLRAEAPLRGLAWLMMLAALIFLVAGLVNPSPGAIGGPTEQRATGMLKITRHPSFVAFTLFGFSHMLMNGWLGDLLFFGSFPTLGILGGLHQDRRKLRELGESYRKFMAETSFFPGAALLSGRHQWSREDVPWAAIGIGTAATILIVILHPFFFGGSPLG